MGYEVGYLSLPKVGYPTLALTNTKIRSAKVGDRPRKLWDERGLFLLLTLSGSKLWRFKYKFDRREKSLSFGAFPHVSLSQARTLREEALAQLRSGIDPSAARRAKRESRESDATSFEIVAREWFAKKQPGWASSHSSKVLGRLERDIFPKLGNRAIKEIGARELLAVLQRIEDRGAVETAHRAKQSCGQIFRYGVATGRVDRDPCADLKGALAPPVRKHYATITDPVEVGALLRAIEEYPGSPITQLALKLAPLVFVRPGELRAAEWQEIRLNVGEWRIPASRMKKNTEHVVPLSRQAIMIIGELAQITGSGRFLFPGVRSRKRCMSENTLNAALRTMGYMSEDMTAHGFRSMASTLLNEQEWNADAIERQLAHAPRDGIRATYNHADYLSVRRKMMQAWADYLDDLRIGARVVPIPCPMYAK